ncbi:hypothetical protein F4777DRAFT_544233 [Nemania sp. FL0916]|nr:hypothetical protein F4777DRAFT_544233 [Nemania sp. FL0916]
MGIRGLRPAIRTFGAIKPLSGNTVVIDGPGLVHEVFHETRHLRPSTAGFTWQPSYSTLSRLVIEWLDSLRSHNVIVRRIYFDGYLPPSKWPERRRRLDRLSRTIEGLIYETGPGSPGFTFGKLRCKIDDFQASLPKPSRPHLLPSFMVPAVLEALRKCPAWGHLVELVPGEAEMSCVDDVRRDGGVVLTNDSDVLIMDLGSNGKMSFFADIAEIDTADLSDNSKQMRAYMYSLSDINRTLGLSDTRGLTRVAFEKMKMQDGFVQALKRARDTSDDELDSAEFEAFMSQYSTGQYLAKDHPVQTLLHVLDPRISEIVIQTILLGDTGITPVEGSTNESRGPDTLSMFLPVMIEDHRRKSAWTMSGAVRQLAYGILQTFVPRGSPIAIEYRTLRASNSQLGRRVGVPGSEESLEQCHLLLHSFDILIQRIPTMGMQWLAFAIYQDVSLSEMHQQSAVSVSLVDQAKLEDIPATAPSWDLIHFTAQVQASFYSLRMLKQILDVGASLCPPLPAPMQELRKRLDTHPPITEWPTVDNISQALLAASEAGAVSVIFDLLGISETEARGVDPEIRSPKPSTATGKEIREARLPPNRFGLLSTLDPDR